MNISFFVFYIRELVLQVGSGSGACPTGGVKQGKIECSGDLAAISSGLNRRYRADVGLRIYGTIMTGVMRNFEFFYIIFTAKLMRKCTIRMQTKAINFD